MKKNNSLNVLYIIFLICIVVIVLFLFFHEDKEDDDSNAVKINSSDRIKVIENVDEVSFLDENVNSITNLECDSSNKKINYTLKLENNEITVINEDNFENYALDKIKNVKTMKSIMYSSNCDEAVYIILTNDGTIYYSYDDIVKTNNVKKMSKNFKKLSTSYNFTELKIGSFDGNNEVFAYTDSSELLRLNFR